MEELLALANRTALRVWNNPEAEDAAAECLLVALRTHDPEKGSLEANVVFRVRLGVLDAMRRKRRRKEKNEPEGFWYNEVYDYGGCAAVPRNAEASPERRRGGYRSYDDGELPVEQDDWCMLVERHVERIPLDVIARRRGITKYRARKMLSAAVVRLMKSNQ